MPQSAGPTVVTYAGIDPRWPARLAELRTLHPATIPWIDSLVADLAEWGREPEQLATGWFDRNVGELLTPHVDAATAMLAPFALAGSVLANLGSLRVASDLGWAEMVCGPATIAIGHSAGLINVAAARGDHATAVAALKFALRLGIAATTAAIATGTAASRTQLVNARREPDEQLTPMAAVADLTASRLGQLLAAHAEQQPGAAGVRLGVTNTRTHHVIVGPATDLRSFRAFLDAQHDQPRHRWEPLLASVPFHHECLGPAAVEVAQWAERHRIDLAAADATELAAAIVSRPQDWADAVRQQAGPDVTMLAMGDVPAVHRSTSAVLRGTGTRFIEMDTPAGRAALRRPETAPEPADYRRFAPTRTGDRLVTRHTRLTGRSPIILAGMTPTTVDAGIVAAAANAGHVAELAGGGQVTASIFNERITELTELLQPGCEIVFNALLLDPYLWDLQLGADRLVQRARAAGAPICGVTVSAGVPALEDAVELLEELHDLGIWLNAFKPGSVRQVDQVLRIAEATEHPIWLHLEGGAAGGHHGWEALDDLLLSTYHDIRSHDNVVLCAGGGVGDPDRAAELLHGTWSRKYGQPAMPVDAVLVGTAAMAAAEATTSASVKRLLVATSGTQTPLDRGQWLGDMTSGRSGLNADIHFVDNTASRTAALLDEVAGDDEAVASRREEIVAALAGTAKPYFGDVARFTYTQLLSRFAELTAIAHHGRYEDGVWLDTSHRRRFIDLLQRAEARLHPDDHGYVTTRFGEPHTVDDPAKAIAALVAEHPRAATARLHPADVDHFLLTCRLPGKPVPFVPVLDADVRRWYQSDALWQSHHPHYDADQVLVIPGPAAVSGIRRVDEPIAELMDRFEAHALATATADESPDALVAQTLAAPTLEWLGVARPNPLRRIATAWQMVDGAAHWACGSERAELSLRDGEPLLLLEWAGPADQQEQFELAIMAVPTHRGRRFLVTRDALVAATKRSSNTPAGSPQAHAATVRADTTVPDAAMGRLWPDIFATLAEVAPHAALDLVHVHHRLRPGTESGARLLDIVHESGGYVIGIESGDGSTTSTDRFLVRQPHSAAPEASGGEVAEPVIEWVDRPDLLLGSIRELAPERLESFAMVTGDHNPIHRSDALARFVGLPGRIVHGMWTSALGQRAAIELACDGNSDRLADWSISFLAPVLPGSEVTATVTRTGVGAGRRRVSVELSVDDELVASAVATVTGPKVAYVFPGQGIQSVGMGMAGFERSAAAREVWQRADRHCRDSLGFSILTVVRDNPTSLIAGLPGRPDAAVTYRHPAGVLNLTQFTQVAMATLASSQVAELREAGVFDESAVTAGHSVGEYNALAAVTGALSLEAVLDLVFARGTAMHHLVPRDALGASDYRLGVVRPHLAGLDHAATEELVAEVAAGTGELCEIVNHNLRGKQYAVAGTVTALTELGRRLNQTGTAKPAFLLVPGIDVPFHSSALRPGVAEFRNHLERSLPPRIDPSLLVDRYVPNLHPEPFALTCEYVTAVVELTDSEPLRRLLSDWDRTDPGVATRILLTELLAWQFASPVRWIETTDALCQELGVERVIEVGVGNQPTLTNLTKGALALPDHRGNRPSVHNLEADVETVFDRAATPVTEPDADSDASDADESPSDPVEVPVVATPVATAPTVADAPLTHDDALRLLISIRTGRPRESLGDDSIEDLVDGASSRRNQLLMDLGKEFGVSGVDGAHEVPLNLLAAALAERSPAYRFPGPVLAAWLPERIAPVLGRLGTNPGAVADRLADHWSLGPGWVDRISVALALAGDAAVGTPADVVDTAVQTCAAELEVTVAPTVTLTDAADNAAAARAAAVLTDVLADTATDLLARLDRLPTGEAAPTLEQPTGRPEEPARFDPARHVFLESGAAWGRADVDHLVHGVAAGRLSDDEVGELIGRLARFRACEPRIDATLDWYRDQADSLFPRSAAHVRTVIARLRELPPATGPGRYDDQVVLVTGASPGSIAYQAVEHLLAGGATVVVVTGDDSADRIADYRDLERRSAGPGAALHVVRANLASLTDIDKVLDWLTAPTVEAVGPTTRETKPALWPTMVLPFAAAPALGSLADTGVDTVRTLSLLLVGVERLIGSLGERIMAANARPARVVLPLSPNHGTFGGDGGYGDAKAALETVVTRWHAEQRSWAAGIELIAAEIGWVRGTGLMAANDHVAAHVEEALGVTTFSAAQMGELIADALLVDAGDGPVRLDLTGGLSQATGVAAALAGVEPPPKPLAEPEIATLAALPNLPPDPTHEEFTVTPRLHSADMVVIAGIAEIGPWGTSATRWQAELGCLDAAAVADLAWLMGLVTWDRQSACWRDDDGVELAEADLFEALSDIVGDRVGLRVLTDTEAVAASGATTLAEVYLERPLQIGEQIYPAGTAIRVPTARPLARQVGGQLPTGSDPTRFGIEPSIAESIDPLAAWNLVVTAAALSDAGVTAEELSSSVPPTQIGNSQGTGMGGMTSLHSLYLDPVVGRSHANDLLQEALGNVVSAHTNQSLIGGYGPMVHPVAACATAAVSLEEAVDKIRLGKAQVVVGGGWDDLSSEGIDGFAAMSATADNEAMAAAGIAPNAQSRPGDRRRRGFVESQGGGSFVVTRGSVALALGLPIRAVVAYAASFGDGIQTSIPAPGLGALGAAHGGLESPLVQALAAHGLTADDIAVVSKHDTSTNANDPNEAFVHATISEKIGRSEGNPLRVISQKAVTGHAKGGAAAWQLAGLCDVFDTGVVPGNQSLTSVDPEVTPEPLVVDHRNLHRATPVRAAVLTSLGFGHVSALIVLAHPQVFLAGLSEEESKLHLERSRSRRLDGQWRTLTARYGGDPVFARRTERPSNSAELDLLLGRG